MPVICMSVYVKIAMSPNAKQWYLKSYIIMLKECRPSVYMSACSISVMYSLMWESILRYSS